MDVYKYRRYILNRGERNNNDSWENVVLRLPISVARQYSWLWMGHQQLFQRIAKQNMRGMTDPWSNHPLVNSGDAYWLNERTLCLGYKLRSNNAIYRPIFSLIRQESINKFQKNISKMVLKRERSMSKNAYIVLLKVKELPVEIVDKIVKIAY